MKDYPIKVGRKVLHQLELWMPETVSSVVIITDDVVKEHYGIMLQTHLNSAGFSTLLLSFTAGDSAKNLDTFARLQEKLFMSHCDRDSLVVALGGGVVGDVAGFVAATFMRGIRYIQMPTTLLAMVDSSVGGKTGINTSMGKNLIGAFWQPVVVIADIACLESLPKNHLINGLVEVIKIFLTHDAHSFNKLSRDLDAILDGNSELLIDLIKQSITLKLRVVKNDEREEGERVVLNWGHTIGHALEQLSNYQLLHGYAVGLGLLVEAKIAVLMGFLSASAFDVIQSTLKRLSIFARDLNNYSLDAVIRQTHGDKKRRSKRVYYVLLSELGQVYLENNQFAHPVPDAVIRQAYLELMKG